MSEIYTTAQAAEKLGTSPDTVRTWKRRHTDHLLEGQHWIKENDTLYWTQPGIDILAKIQQGIELLSGSELNRSAVQDEPLSSSLLARYEPLLSLLASAISPQLLNRLDTLIVERVQDLTTSSQPLTTAECVNLLTELGLPPAPLSSISGNSPAGNLPPSKQ